MTRLLFRLALLLSVVVSSAAAFVASPSFVLRPPTTTRSISSLHVSSKNNNKEARGGDGLLVERNAERIRTAGRKGTKRFVDPTKVFLGNLPFDANEDDVKRFFLEHLGTTFHLSSIKIIRDWKTHKSKGYGFALFSDPIYATSAMEVCNGRKLKGRPMRLSQGKKKQDPNELYIVKKKKKKRAESEEDRVIQAGLDEAEGIVELDEFDEDDDELFDADDDDEQDFEFDGIFEELYPEQYEPLTEEEQQLNREQRREVARRKRRRKMPHKGFEPPPE